MPLIASEYTCAPIFRNGHIQTIYTRLTRKRRPLEVEHRVLTTPDEDFLDTYWLHQPAQSPEQYKPTQVVLLTHPLESHGKDRYLMDQARALFAQGFSVVTWSMRSCSKNLNNTKWFYSGNDCRDLEFLVETLAKQFDQIYLAGFSMGAAITAFYLGTQAEQLNDKVKGAF